MRREQDEYEHRVRGVRTEYPEDRCGTLCGLYRFRCLAVYLGAFCPCRGALLHLPCQCQTDVGAGK